MLRNVAIPMFGFIENLLRFLGMWDDNGSVWIELIVAETENWKLKTL